MNIPTRNRMYPREIEVKLRFNRQELEAIDRLAASTNLPRAAFMRELLVKKAEQVKLRNESTATAA